MCPSASGNVATSCGWSQRQNGQRAADHVLPQPALALVQARRAARGERRALERRADAALVEAVADLVHAAEQRLEVGLGVARRDADVGRRERGAERMDGAVEPERRRLEAECGHHGEADRRWPSSGNGPVAEAAAALGRSRDQRHELLLEPVEDDPHLGRRRSRLEVVEQDVVRIVGGLEARDVLALQLELPVEPRAEGGVVVLAPARPPTPPCPRRPPWSARRRARTARAAPSPSRGA